MTSDQKSRKRVLEARSRDAALVAYHLHSKCESSLGSFGRTLGEEALRESEPRLRLEMLDEDYGAGRY